MANIITKADFITTIKIANKSEVAWVGTDDLTNFITEYEPQFLSMLFGDDFAVLFIAGIAAAEERFTALLTPQLRKAIATFIYYHYQRDNYEQASGTGIVKSANQNATLTTPRNKLIATWFEMVKTCWSVQRILADDNGVLYPEWVIPSWYSVFAASWLALGWSYGIFESPFYYGFYRRYQIPDIFQQLSRL